MASKEKSGDMEKVPLMGMDMNKDPKDEDSDGDAGCNERYEGVPCDGEQFIWDLEALKEENRNRETVDEITIVLRSADRDRVTPFGIRAHPDMNGVMCLWSMLVPWHVEWLAIWIYFAFALYFWIEAFLIMGHQKDYKLKYSRDWDMMFLATLGIALSLTATCAYLVFYSISHTVNKIFSAFDYMGKLTMVFFYTFAFVGTEL